MLCTAKSLLDAPTPGRGLPRPHSVLLDDYRREVRVGYLLVRPAVLRLKVSKEGAYWSIKIQSAEGEFALHEQRPRSMRTSCMRTVMIFA